MNTLFLKEIQVNLTFGKSANLDIKDKSGYTFSSLMNQENTTKSNSENGKFFGMSSSKTCFESSVLSELRFKKHSSCCKDSHLMMLV